MKYRPVLCLRLSEKVRFIWGLLFPKTEDKKLTKDHYEVGSIFFVQKKCVHFLNLLREVVL